MKVITIGRSEENDVTINDMHASRHHLQIIQHDDGHFTLSDFGSTNGTFVNGQKISGEIPLDTNDFVRIGNTSIPWRMYFETLPPKGVGSNVDTEVKAELQQKQRHGFVTFWLWFMVASNIVGVILNGVLSSQTIYRNIDTICRNITDYPEAFNLDSDSVSTFHDSAYLHTNMLLLTSVLAAICSIIFIFLILKWKKVGFWCWAGGSLIFGIINVIILNQLSNDFSLLNLSTEISINNIIMFALIPLGILILWAILQIKKNGISCWKQLE
jgi:pSer/pThr/pTyr-binding forkhead associated (FHA) protein